MKLKLLTLVNSIDTLNRLNAIRFDDGITAYRVVRNLKNISPEMASFEEFRKGLVEKYGVKKGEMTEVTPENMDVYMKELNPVLEQDVEINITKINPKNISGFSPMELLLIEWMLDEEV